MLKSYDSHYGVKVYGNSHGLLASYASSRHSTSCCVIGQGANGEMERDYSYTAVARHRDELWIFRARRSHKQKRPLAA